MLEVANAAYDASATKSWSGIMLGELHSAWRVVMLTAVMYAVPCAMPWPLASTTSPLCLHWWIQWDRGV